MLNLPKPNFDHLNGIIAGQLAHLFLPATLALEEHGYSGGGGGAAAEEERPLELMVDVVRYLTPNPRLRLLSMRSLPQLPAAALQWEGRERWSPLLRNLRQMLLADTVRLQWKNPDFLSNNSDLLIRNLDFLLKNVDFIINQIVEERANWREGLKLDTSGVNKSSVNKSSASMVFVRGDLSPDPVTCASKMMNFV